jgi:hypothetical protein
VTALLVVVALALAGVGLVASWVPFAVFVMLWAFGRVIFCDRL